jgi:hypothetical protein
MDVLDRDYTSSKYPDGPPHGLRVLLDLGDVSNGGSRRLLRLENRLACTKFTFDNRLVAMNSAAAGSGRRSNIYHGRYLSNTYAHKSSPHTTLII